MEFRFKTETELQEYLEAMNLGIRKADTDKLAGAMWKLAITRLVNMKTLDNQVIEDNLPEADKKKSKVLVQNIQLQATTDSQDTGAATCNDRPSSLDRAPHMS
jgi:hypothetical protein